MILLCKVAVLSLRYSQSALTCCHFSFPAIPFSAAYFSIFASFLGGDFVVSALSSQLIHLLHRWCALLLLCAAALLSHGNRSKPFIQFPPAYFLIFALFSGVIFLQAPLSSQLRRLCHRWLHCIPFATQL